AGAPGAVPDTVVGSTTISLMYSPISAIQARLRRSSATSRRPAAATPPRMSGRLELVGAVVARDVPPTPKAAPGEAAGWGLIAARPDCTLLVAPCRTLPTKGAPCLTKTPLITTGARMGARAAPAMIFPPVDRTLEKLRPPIVTSISASSPGPAAAPRRRGLP